MKHTSQRHDDVINWTFFRVTGPLWGEFPAKRPLMRSFDVFFYLRLNNDWVNNQYSGDLRRHRAYYGVTAMDRVDIASNNGLSRQGLSAKVLLETMYTYW